MRAVIVCLAMLAAGCASDGAVRCSGKLEPINAPTPVISSAGGFAETSAGSEDGLLGKREP